MPKYYIHCGRFFDGVHEDIDENINMIVDEAKIINVGKSLEKPRDAVFVDLSQYTVTPGFIDAHAHYEFIGPETFNSFSISDSDEMKTLNMVCIYLQKCFGIK